MTKQELIDKMAQAIARYEGFYNRTNTVAKRFNNPGNLRRWGTTPVWIPLSGSDGKPRDVIATPQEKRQGLGYAKFATPEDGWAALNNQVANNIDRGLTFYEFFAGKEGVYGGYAPSADGNSPRKYARFVASKVLPAGLLGQSQYELTPIRLLIGWEEAV